MNDLLLGLGSNQGNRSANLAMAHRLLSRTVGLVHKESQLYESAPWGGIEQPAYYNQVLWVKTMLPLEAAFRQCQILEQKMGRQRSQKWGPRIIDVDLLYYNDVQLETPELVVPHPQLQDRRFVLLPLCDVAPHYEHPVLKRSSKELLSVCSDALSVTPLVLA